MNYCSSAPYWCCLCHSQEDVDSMQKELKMWKTESERHTEALRKEQRWLSSGSLVPRLPHPTFVASIAKKKALYYIFPRCKPKAMELARDRGYSPIDKWRTLLLCLYTYVILLIVSHLHYNRTTVVSPLRAQLEELETRIKEQVGICVWYLLYYVYTLCATRMGLKAQVSLPSSHAVPTPCFFHVIPVWFDMYMTLYIIYIFLTGWSYRCNQVKCAQKRWENSADAKLYGIFVKLILYIITLLHIHCKNDVFCHSGCRWVNQSHPWIQIIAWQFRTSYFDSTAHLLCFVHSFKRNDKLSFIVIIAII